MRVSPQVVRAFQGVPGEWSWSSPAPTGPRAATASAPTASGPKTRDGPRVIVNREGEASFAGIPTFAKLPLVLDPGELAGVDVAILRAPMDETVSNRPGSRYGPRAIRQADEGSGLPPSRPHMLLGVDPFAILTVVDYGDAKTIPGDTAPSHVRSVCGSRRSAPPARSQSCSAATTRSPTRI